MSTTVLVVVTAVALLFSAPPALADTAIGTKRADRIRDARGDGQLFGFAGNDVLNGGGGIDLVDGGAGRDRLRGGAGSDTLRGEGCEDAGRCRRPSSDRISGAPGNDFIEGNACPTRRRCPRGSANDRLSGDGGDDALVVRAPGRSLLMGGLGNDSIRGGAGRDRIRGGSGVDRIWSGGGDDHVDVRDGQVDHVVCASGRDTVSADRHDAVDQTCERIRRRGGASSAAQADDPGAVGCCYEQSGYADGTHGRKYTVVDAPPDREVKEWGSGVVTDVIQRGRLTCPLGFARAHPYPRSISSGGFWRGRALSASVSSCSGRVYKVDRATRATLGDDFTCPTDCSAFSDAYLPPGASKEFWTLVHVLGDQEVEGYESFGGMWGNVVVSMPDASVGPRFLSFQANSRIIILDDDHHRTVRLERRSKPVVVSVPSETAALRLMALRAAPRKVVLVNNGQRVPCKPSGCPAIVRPLTDRLPPGPPPTPPTTEQAPDLVVDSIRAGSGAISIVVKNTGSAVAGAGKLAYSLDGVGETLVDFPALPPGQTTALGLPCPRGRSIAVAARADATNVVVESAEDNNARSATIDCS